MCNGVGEKYRLLDKVVKLMEEILRYPVCKILFLKKCFALEVQDKKEI